MLCVVGGAPISSAREDMSPPSASSHLTMDWVGQRRSELCARSLGTRSSLCFSSREAGPLSARARRVGAPEAEHNPRFTARVCLELGAQGHGHPSQNKGCHADANKIHRGALCLHL